VGPYGSGEGSELPGRAPRRGHPMSFLAFILPLLIFIGIASLIYALVKGKK
jgi:hypothetical protein